MNAIRVRTHVDSETLHLPQLKPMIGKDVEIIVLETAAESNGLNCDSSRRKTLEEIAAEQGKQPITNVRVLLGGWPEDERNDGFEAELRERRKKDMVKDLDE